jgi:eukaryotic-like serine/threonine-protein kinase
MSSAIIALIAGHTTSTWLYFKAAAAERQQTGLRAVAEQALKHEATLRREAEDRERVAHAAILLLERRFAEADTVVRQIPGPLRRPSVEAANVFRELAEWNLLQGDLAGAARRVRSLLEVNRFNESDQTNVMTRDLVVVAPTIVEAGELGFYEELRANAARKFAHTRSPVAAEQVMKTCLLLPLSADLLQAVESLAEMQEQCVSERSTGLLDRAWGSIALGLLEYRRGSYEKGVDWSVRSRNTAYRNKAHEALCFVVDAMCRWELGQDETARTALTQARQLVDGWFARPTRGPEMGAWNDWLIAKILLREADRKITSPVVP